MDLPYNRVAHRFFKVPEYLALDYIEKGETATCDWMIMTDDDAYAVLPKYSVCVRTYRQNLHRAPCSFSRYINIRQWENLFQNTPWIKSSDVWHVGPLQGIGFHKGSVQFAHGTSIVFSRGAITKFGQFAVRLTSGLLIA